MTTAAPKRRLRMRELERATGVSRESIRFYIREGLLPEPERLGRNVALYDESFVERIRLIKDLQRRRYLPLAVIKAVVAGETAPTTLEVEAARQLDGRLATVAPGGARPERLSAVAKRAGLPAREVRQLAQAEAFDIVTRDGDQWLDAPAVRIVELWAELRRVGFTPERGCTPDDVRPYVEFVRLLAREELGLFSRRVAGRVPRDEMVRMAETAIGVLSELIGILRRQTLLRLIADGNVPTPQTTKSPRPKAS